MKQGWLRRRWARRKAPGTHTARTPENAESFHKRGPWIVSSRGFRVRALGRAGMEYLEAGVRLHIDSEAMATRDFVVFANSIPADTRPRIIDNVTRAWGCDRFGVDVE